MADNITQLLNKYKDFADALADGRDKLIGDILADGLSDTIKFSIGIGPIQTAEAAELAQKVGELSFDVTNESLRADILQKQVGIVSNRLGVSTTEAANFTRSSIALAIDNKGLDAHRVLSALNAEEKRILNFSENPSKIYGIELETALKASFLFSAAAGVALTTSLVLFTVLLFRFGPKAVAAMGSGSLTTIAQTLAQASKSKIFLGASAAFLISQALGHWATQIPLVVNQLVDLGTITPTMRAGALVDIEKLKKSVGAGNIFSEMKGGAGLGGDLGAAAPRETRSKSTQYKIYVGTLLGGRVAEGKDFHPIIDDEITDTQDLVEGAMANLVKFLPTMPSRMTWEIQVKNSPFDQDGVRQSGFWLTFSVYYVSRWNKRTFLDEFLLGPVNPARYPVLDRESVSVTTPLLSGDGLAMGQAQTISAGRIATTDNEGNKVEVLPVSARPTESAALSGATGPLPSSTAELEAMRDRLLKEKSELERSIAFASGTPPADFMSRIAAENATAKAPEGIRAASGQALGHFIQELGLYSGQIALVDTPGTVLRLREESGLNQRIIADLPHRTEVTVNGYAGEVDGYTWANVNVVVEGRMKNGNVASRFLMAE